jgi:Protein of unknown function (DUF1592)/Protein of unknown function (DUF1588)/Protein of unknown function (DUF1595)/Protein of unknown function (DUF1587)/Protein of unknown function (DUF1585)
MQRLTATQYANAVKEVFSLPALQLKLPEDGEAQFDSIAASQVASIPDHVVLYQAAASQVVAAAAQGSNFLSGCKPTSASDACIDMVLKTAAEKLWRRQPTGEELGRLKAIVTAAGTGTNKVQTGLLRAVEAQLFSPHFLYQAYFGEGSGTGPKKLTGPELASRASLFLWNSLPDDQLMAAANSGQLSTDDGYFKELQRMLASPKARGLASRVLSEGWNVRRLDEQTKNANLYPAWSAATVTSMKTEFNLLVEEAARDGVDFRSLYTVDHTFADGNLAKIYGTPEPSTPFAAVPLAANRHGIFGTAALLTVSNTHAESSAPIFRGIFVQEKLLCEKFVTPSQDFFDQVLAEEGMKPPRSNATRVEERRNNTMCWGCHQVIDPIGLAAENFDGIGQFRTKYGAYDVVNDGMFDMKPVNSVGALSKMLVESDRLTWCLTSTIYAAATAHNPVKSESAAIISANAAFAAQGHRFSDLILGVMQSEGFRSVMPSQ